MTKEQEPKDPYPFIHSFPRYFEQSSERFDRLRLILQHGLLSPREAERRGIPFKKETEFFRIKKGENPNHQYVDYDDYIFVYSVMERGSMPIPGNTSVLFDQSLQVTTSQEMQKMNSSFWVVTSVGERYVKNRIAPELIREIRVWGGDRQELEQIVKEIIPEPRGVKIKV